MGTFREAYQASLQAEVSHHYSTIDPAGVDAHIDVREMWAVVDAGACWGHLWRDRSVVFVTDSTTIRAALTMGHCANKVIMQWLRQLFWCSIKFNFDIKSVYISRADNVISDALSRCNDPLSRSSIHAVDQLELMCCSYLFK